MHSLDLPTIALVTINMIQMLLSLLLIFPVIDIVNLSKAIKVYTVEYHRQFRILAVIYNSFVIWHGIIAPIKKLNSLGIPKAIAASLSSREKLTRVIEASNARRNFQLGCLSLFLSLTSLRLFDYIEFSAKLHEFSKLMANYSLVDVQLKEKIVETEFVIEDYFEEDSDDKFVCDGQTSILVI